MSKQDSYSPIPPEGVKMPFHSGKKWGMYCAFIILVLSIIHVTLCYLLTLNTTTGKDIFRYYQEGANVLRRRYVEKKG